MTSNREQGQSGVAEPTAAGVTQTIGASNMANTHRDIKVARNAAPVNPVGRSLHHWSTSIRREHFKVALSVWQRSNIKEPVGNLCTGRPQSHRVPSFFSSLGKRMKLNVSGREEQSADSAHAKKRTSGNSKGAELGEEAAVRVNIR